MLKNKKYIFLSAAAVILLAAGAFLLFNRERTISVVEHLGEVLMSKVDLQNEINVYDGMRMEQGDVIRTQEKARAVVEIDESKLVKIQEKTSASFQDLSGNLKDNQTNIYLESGTLINDIHKKLSGDSSYTVNTPNTTVSVRGTYFVVSVTEDPQTHEPVTTVKVYNGRVETQYRDENDEMKSIAVDAGKTLTVAKRTVKVEDKLDFDDFDKEELERLIELAMQQETGYTVDEAQQQMQVLEQQAAPAEEESQQGTSVEKKEVSSGADDSEQLQTEVETTQSQILDIDALPRNTKAYAQYPDLPVGIPNKDELVRSLDQMAQSAADLTEQQKADISFEKVEQAKGKIAHLEKAAEVSTVLNDLPQPSAITLDSETAISTASALVNALDAAQEKAFIPEQLLSKLTECEQSLALSQECAGLIDGLDDKDPDMEQGNRAVEIYVQLGDGQRQALGEPRIEKLRAIYKRIQQMILEKESGDIEKENLIAVDVSLSQIDLSGIDVQGKDVVIKVESYADEPAAPVKDKMGHEMEVAACYDIRLVAQIGDGEKFEVQPREPVKVKIQIPEKYYEAQTFMIWHVLNLDKIENIGDFEIIEQNGARFLIFYVNHFSQFVVTASKDKIYKDQDVVEAKLEKDGATKAAQSARLSRNVVIAILFFLLAAAAVLYIVYDQWKLRRKVQPPQEKREDT